MALAGPGANFSLVLIAAIAIRVGIALHYFPMPESANFTHVTEAAVAGIRGLCRDILERSYSSSILFSEHSTYCRCRLWTATRESLF